ncbi:MAG: esterase-like activity of phytase family protein [Bacteroidota bacterium]
MSYQTMRLSLLVLFGATCFLAGCDDDDNGGGGPDPLVINSLTYVDEFVIAPDTLNGNVIGGLSSIDYNNGTYYMISDAASAPIRFYTATIDFNDDSISTVNITGEVEIKDTNGSSFADGQADPEAIRYEPANDRLVWTSEGFINSGVDPFVRTTNAQGTWLETFTLPDAFNVQTDPDLGPLNNGVIEGLSRSVDGDGYWLAMELPLKQDGPAPMITDTESPVRILYMDRASGNFGRQFAYELDPVVRPGGFMVNGVVEILAYEEDQFLVLERSFSTGYDDGGNDVKIYQVDASMATDVSGIDALAGASYTPAIKTLLFDFESVRSQLTDGIVDNIEGITFGPDLPNGKKSLLLVADNNFSAFGPQLNQVILMEVN